MINFFNVAIKWLLSGEGYSTNNTKILGFYKEHHVIGSSRINSDKNSELILEDT